MGRQFKVWARNNQYGQLINDLNRDYSKYGTCVAKKVGDDIKRVNIRKLRCKQNEETLEAAARRGYVIEEHDISVQELYDYPDWVIEDLEKDSNEMI